MGIWCLFDVNFVGVLWLSREDGVRFMGKLGTKREKQESLKGISRPFHV